MQYMPGRSTRSDSCVRLTCPPASPPSDSRVAPHHEAPADAGSPAAAPAIGVPAMTLAPPPPRPNAGALPLDEAPWCGATVHTPAVKAPRASTTTSAAASDAALATVRCNGMMQAPPATPPHALARTVMTSGEPGTTAAPPSPTPPPPPSPLPPPPTSSLNTSGSLSGAARSPATSTSRNAPTLVPPPAAAAPASAPAAPCAPPAAPCAPPAAPCAPPSAPLQLSPVALRSGSCQVTSRSTGGSACDRLSAASGDF
eukprot:365066-Chlamydomonas_euryale.AAC.6